MVACEDFSSIPVNVFVLVHVQGLHLIYGYWLRMHVLGGEFMCGCLIMLLTHCLVA